MNTYLQDSTLLAGSADEIRLLETKNEALVLVFSDSHGRYQILEDILLKRQSRPDALIFCGDGINDLSVLFAKAQESPELAERIPPVISFVRGNCDPNVYSFKMPETSAEENAGEYIQFELPVIQTLKIANHTVFSTHGHLYISDFGNDELINAGRAVGADIILSGHTHIPSSQMYGNTLILNPGSIALPKQWGNQKGTFAELKIYSDKQEVEHNFFAIDSNRTFPVYTNFW